MPYIGGGYGNIRNNLAGSVEVVRDSTGSRNGARMAIYNVDQASGVFYASFAPRTISYSGFGSAFNETSRPDRKPILTRNGDNLRKMSMELFIGSENMNEDQTVNLNTLEAIALSDSPVLVEYESRTKGNWRITSLTYDSVLRNGEDEITRATAQIEFTEIDYITGNTFNYTAKRPKKINVVSGMTLHKIAEMYYGTSSPLTINAIAKANKITDRRHLPPKIKLP